MYRDSLSFAAGPSCAPQRQLPWPAEQSFPVDSEYGRLRRVLVGDPAFLALLPCNSVSEEAIREGRSCCPSRALSQHQALVAAIESEGVQIERIPSRSDLPDLAFTRDSTLMTPWGQIGLRPGAAHRASEVDAALAAIKAAGLPVLCRIEEGHVEGGDLAMIRPGLLVIGVSGCRTDERGAEAVAALFRRQGWEVILYPFDPHFLHLDTIFCMVDSGLALACTDVLDDAFLARLERLGIELIPVTYKEARRLGCNLLSLGSRRVVTSGTCPGADQELARRNYRVIRVELDEFITCGGGVHCLTMPLERDPG